MTTVTYITNISTKGYQEECLVLGVMLVLQPDSVPHQLVDYLEKPGMCILLVCNFYMASSVSFVLMWNVEAVSTVI